MLQYSQSQLQNLCLGFATVHQQADYRVLSLRPATERWYAHCWAPPFSIREGLCFFDSPVFEAFFDLFLDGLVRILNAQVKTNTIAKLNNNT